MLTCLCSSGGGGIFRGGIYACGVLPGVSAVCTEGLVGVIGAPGEVGVSGVLGVERFEGINIQSGAFFG